MDHKFVCQLKYVTCSKTYAARWPHHIDHKKRPTQVNFIVTISNKAASLIELKKVMIGVLSSLKNIQKPLKSMGLIDFEKFSAVFERQAKVGCNQKQAKKCRCLSNKASILILRELFK